MSIEFLSLPPPSFYPLTLAGGAGGEGPSPRRTILPYWIGARKSERFALVESSLRLAASIGKKCSEETSACFRKVRRAQRAPGRVPLQGERQWGFPEECLPPNP